MTLKRPDRKAKAKPKPKAKQEKKAPPVTWFSTGLVLDVLVWIGCLEPLIVPKRQNMYSKVCANAMMYSNHSIIFQDHDMSFRDFRG